MLMVEDHPGLKIIRPRCVDDALCGFSFPPSAAIWGRILPVNDIQAMDQLSIGAGPAMV
jgi:hypothetical protein